MSHTKKKTFIKEEQMYSDHNRKNVDRFKRNKSEKKLSNALRSNNLDELLSLDNYT